MSNLDDIDVLAGALAEDDEITPPGKAPAKLGVEIGPNGWNRT